MTNEITDKNFIVLIRGGYKIYINEKQMEIIKENMKQGKTIIYLEKGLFNANDISFILPASEVEKDERIKKGEWQCEYRTWHQRGEGCGCADLLKYKKFNLGKI